MVFRAPREIALIALQGLGARVDERTDLFGSCGKLLGLRSGGLLVECAFGWLLVESGDVSGDALVPSLGTGLRISTIR